MKSSNNFIREESILVILILIVFINPFFYGHRIALIFFFFVLFQGRRLKYMLDVNVIYLLLFSFSYEIISALRFDSEKDWIVVVPNIFIPSIIYSVGKYVSVKQKNNNSRIYFLFYTGLIISIIPMLSVFIQIYKFGFSTGIRSINLIWDENLLLNATNIAGYLTLSIASIGLINFKSNNNFEKKIKKWGVVLAILAIVCALRLGSRTQIIIIISSILLSFSLFLKYNSIRRILSLSLTLFIGIFVSYTVLSKNLQLLTFFADRMENQEHGIITAGGRVGRWIGSFNAIFTDPLGWEFTRYGYAHNLWLDVARVGGIIPFFFLIVFTLSAFWNLICSYRVLRTNIFLKNYLVLYFASFILVFSVEPVLDGYYLLFLLFILHTGFIKGIQIQNLNK